MKVGLRTALILITLLICAGSAAAQGNQPQLSAQDQKVIDYLVRDWGEDYSVTTVDQAMKAVKVESSEENRFRIGSYIKAHPELHEIIRRWGWVTLVLTPEEKLIARALINAQRDGNQRHPFLNWLRPWVSKSLT